MWETEIKITFFGDLKMRGKKGVTLVELLIVVLILGALAAIAIPRLTQSADTAKTNGCKTNVDIINSQIELYAAEFLVRLKADSVI